ncbi:MAG: metallophosphoesterase [Flavobacteriaceae bacterium]
MRIIHYPYYLFVLFMLGGCATYQLQVSDKAIATQSLPLVEGDGAVNVFLIGDAGKAHDGGASPALQTLANYSKEADADDLLLFLGDNAYPKGIPKKEDDHYEEALLAMNLQLEVAKQFPGKVIFIPGNHDWYSGSKGLKTQEKLVEEALGKEAFLPEDGCPIETVDLSDDIVLIVIDSQWYITNWDRYPTMNDDCDIKTRERFFEELESEVKKARGKTTLIAVHHPMFSNGPHGGHYSFGDYQMPLPVLGFLKNSIRKSGGIINSDLQNKHYNEFRKRLIALAQQNSKTVFVSGHEHNLQYIVQDNLPQIVSGSGSKLNPTKNTHGGLFSYGAPGFGVLSIRTDGSSKVSFVSANDQKIVFQQEVLPKDQSSAKIEFATQFPPKVTASIYTPAETEKSGFYKFLWGERFRRYYSTPIEAQTVSLDTLYGGLVPVRKGGGHQSKSLRLKDRNGTQYVMRALRKQPVQYLQSTVFRDQYIEGQFDDTKTESLVLDVFTGAHPYAPFVIGDLADAVGVYHTNPRLFYVPKQAALDGYTGDFGDELYMIEEHTSKGHGDLASFGYSDKIISTYDLFNKLHKDEDFTIDGASYIRARLFDMLIGDWDRHQDQWRWIEFKENGKKVYRPLPRDRDQAFSRMSDGVLLGAVTALTPGARLLRKYSGDLKDVKGMNLEPYPLDMAFLGDTPKEVWDQQVVRMQEGLTDEVIEKAFLNLPKEVSDATVEEIKDMLKSRRKNLQAISDRYYKLVSKLGVITGTDKDDAFVITAHENGNVTVEVYRIKDGMLKDKFHERTYNPLETKELWLYGLDDDDTFTLNGKSKKIKIRLVGGQNNDVYNIPEGKNVILYDYQSKPNDISKARNASIRLRDDYETNNYDYKKLKTNTNQLVPSIGSNPDDGFRLGILDTYTVYGFERNPFTSKHTLRAEYYFATEGFDATYQGFFAHLPFPLNLGFKARITSDTYVGNFFGYGNSTPNEGEDDAFDVDSDFNRIRQQHMEFTPSLSWKGFDGAEVILSVGFESVEVDRTPDRFLATILPEEASVFGSNDFLKSNLNYHFKNQDNEAYPTLGLEASIEGGFTKNLKNSNQFGFVIPSLTFIQKISPDGRLVFATKIKGRWTLGDDYEFYQAATLGADDGLRGYRNQRFTGKNSFYQNMDLRYSFNRIKTAIVPITLGIYGGFDYGKVWIDDRLVLDPSHNQSRFNTSYGGGLLVEGADMLTGRLSLFASEEGMRFSFGLGFDF